MTIGTAANGRSPSRQLMARIYAGDFSKSTTRGGFFAFGRSDLVALFPQSLRVGCDAAGEFGILTFEELPATHWAWNDKTFG